MPKHSPRRRCIGGKDRLTMQLPASELDDGLQSASRALVNHSTG